MWLKPECAWNCLWFPLKLKKKKKSPLGLQFSLEHDAKGNVFHLCKSGQLWPEDTCEGLEGHFDWRRGTWQLIITPLLHLHEPIVVLFMWNGRLAEMSCGNYKGRERAGGDASPSHLMGLKFPDARGSGAWWLVAQCAHVCIVAAPERNNTGTPRPAHGASEEYQRWPRSSCEAHKQSRPTPLLIKPDHNNEAPSLTSLRDNKQCFDMVLNIPFPPTHTHTHSVPYCVRPSRRHVMELC